MSQAIQTYRAIVVQARANTCANRRFVTEAEAKEMAFVSTELLEAAGYVETYNRDEIDMYYRVRGPIKTGKK